MYTHNRYIHFEEKGESFICRRGKIKQNIHGKLYLEVFDIPGYEGWYKVKINDWLSNTLQNTRCSYVEVTCKDADKQYVDIREATHMRQYESYTAECNDDDTDDLRNFLEEKIRENEEENERWKQIIERL